MISLFQQIARDESGQDLIEYAMMAGMLSVAAVATLPTLKPAIVKLFSNLTKTITDAVL